MSVTEVPASVDVAALLAARREHVPCAPPSASRPLGMAEAYAVQDRVRDALVASVERVVGWKAGFTSLGARGLGLRAGDLVMTGSVSALLRPKPGDTISATYTRLGSVSARFV